MGAPPGIGVTNQIRERLKELQTGNPRPLLIMVLFPEGENGWTEERMHARFDAQRAMGEWFRLEGEVATWLSATIEAASIKARGQSKA